MIKVLSVYDKRSKSTFLKSTWFGYYDCNLFILIKNRIIHLFFFERMTKLKLRARLGRMKPKSLENPKNEWLNEIVSQAPSADKQIPFLLAAVEARKIFFEKAVTFRTALENSLRDWFKKPITVELFGSAATHLALKDSDIDVYVNLDNHSVGEKDMQLLTDFFIANKSLYNHFQTIDFIDASVPIFKGVTVSGLKCDVSFTSPFAIYDSDIINFIIKADERIRKVIVLLKFWFKKQDLYGGDSNRFKSHAIVLLVIFYLQQRKVLPSIHTLQKNCNSKKEIDGWIVSFSGNSSQVLLSLSLLDMLKGFFGFYAKFDFKSNVVSPFIGEAIPKAAFSNMQSLTGFDCLKKKSIESNFLMDDLNGTMWVQDFIVHSTNVTKNVRENLMNEFKQSCLEAYNVFESKENPSVLFINTLFSKLFKPSDRIVEIVECSRKRDGDIFRILKIRIGNNDGEIDKFFTFLNSLLANIMRCEVDIRDENNKKVYECKISMGVLTCRNFKETVFQECKFTNGETLIGVTKRISDSFHLNKKFQPGRKYAFEIICSKESTPTSIQSRLIYKEKKGQRAFLAQTFFELISFIRIWARIEL